MPLLAAIDPGPFENCREYGSKPASRSNTTETFPPIGSIPLMPMNELLNALGARVQIDPLFCFWIRYELPTADFGSKAAPWLCHASLPGSICMIVRWYKVGRQHRIGSICSDARKFRSKWQPRHSHLKKPTGSARRQLL